MTCEGLPLKMPELKTNEVHIWNMELALYKEELERLGDLLNDSEWERAGKFAFEKDRTGFIIRRGVLKELLGGYLGVEAETINLAYDEMGKPRLGERNDLYFNMSDSGGIVLYAFTRGREIGIDVEYMRNEIEFDEIVGSFFSEDEQSEYFSLKAEERAKGFYTGWTRKEAYLKAIGKGLSRELDQFSVKLVPNSTGGSVIKDEDWWVEDLDCPEGFQAALCAEGTGVKAAYFQVSK